MSLVGASTPNRSLRFTAWPCNSPHVQKRFRHIRFVYTPSLSNAQRCSPSWRWKNGILLRAQRRRMSWSANASKKNGSADGTGYESDFLRALSIAETFCTEAALDSQSRPHITRKLRNRLGTSPPPTPLVSYPNGVTNGTGPTPPGPITNPHSLSVDELPSPFPLPLTATSLPHMTAGNVSNNGGRRRPKGGGFQVQAVGGLGKSGASLTGCKETEIESDLGEIRRGNKRRRGGGVSIIKP